MTPQEKGLLSRIRKAVAAAIRQALEEDGYCKSYEGTFEIGATYPNYFEDATGTASPDGYFVTLHCYVLGPSRHYTWTGDTPLEALQTCQAELENWGIEV